MAARDYLDKGPMEAVGLVPLALRAEVMVAGVLVEIVEPAGLLVGLEVLAEHTVLVVVVVDTSAVQKMEARPREAQSALSGPAILAHSHQLVQGHLNK